MWRRNASGFAFQRELLISLLTLNQTVLSFLWRFWLITTRIPKEWGRYCFHRCLSVHISWVPTFQPTRVGTYLPANEKGRYPLARVCIPLAKVGTPTIVSTCYVVGSMPLAFMQENFLVKIKSNLLLICRFLTKSVNPPWFAWSYLTLAYGFQKPMN